ncbi:tripartite tricarboxylate transporter [Rhodobacterales bacterium HKCCE2091]|nr:tripartite tricarboxylate transporter [Rhodobacterales bacterium HKCCE2091]
MGSLTQVTIDFDTSHLVFPIIIGTVLGLLGLAILIRDRASIAAAPGYWRHIWQEMDKVRFFGTIVLTLAYFGAMVPVGNIWPNTGMGFLICSVPYVFAVGVLYLHDRRPRNLWPIALLAVIAPPLSWWLFSYVFFLALP